eukprot:6938891-Prorocentrum_lima.AAC.1
MDDRGKGFGRGAHVPPDRSIGYAASSGWGFCGGSATAASSWGEFQCRDEGKSGRCLDRGLLPSPPGAR